MKKAIGLLTLAAIYCNFCSWAASPCKANTTAGQAESSEPLTSSLKKMVFYNYLIGNIL